MSGGEGRRAELDRQLMGVMMRRDGAEPAAERIGAMFRNVMDALPLAVGVTPDGEGWRTIPGLPKVAMSRAVLGMSDHLPDLIDGDGRIYLAPRGELRSERLTLAAGAAIGSRAIQAGAHLVPLPDSGRVFSDGNRVAVERHPGAFVTIAPAPFAKVDLGAAGEGEAPTVPLPVSVARVDRGALAQWAVRFEVLRSVQKARGLEQVSTEIAVALALGMGRAIDMELLGTVAAGPLAPFGIGAAAAAGVKWGELAAMVGTAGAGAATERGRLFAAGVPAELTDTITGTVVGAWSRFAVAALDEVELLVERQSGTGKLIVTAWMGLQALTPEGGFAWSVA